MKRSKKIKSYAEITVDELREATKEFDVPSDSNYGFKPLTAKKRAEWNRVKRGPGRPKVGKGATSVLVSIERGLLKQADEFAKKNGLSRSWLMSQGLRTVLAKDKFVASATSTRRKSA